MNSVNLKLDWCTFKAAEYACKHWHYSKTIPASKLVKIGVWENNIFTGVIIFSRGANANLLKPYGLKVTEGCELTRIALNKHFHPVTKMVSIAVKMLKRFSPGLKLIVSFADSNQGHLGKIYQAGNWIYTGLKKVDPLSEVIKGKPKHKYLMPLNEQTREKVLLFTKPFPRASSIDNDAASIQKVETGSIPSEALHFN
jgi:hypothetical protein